ncbi:MAG: ABC transporter ATP-binding protein [Gemmatimonadota bacterium]|nr:ABC transporter ATP-binding protein [Gemmatimonadota bacterium]
MGSRRPMGDDQAAALGDGPQLVGEAAPTSEVVIETRGLERVYATGRTEVRALDGVDVSIHDGEFVAIMGASGSGKSTFMNILGCLDRPTGGSYTLSGTQVELLNKNELADIRNARIGFVFQSFNLLSRTAALDNVELPLLYDRSGRKLDSRKAAAEALQRVGLGDRLDHEPSELSGGEQQRVAIARALVGQPSMILADEPTGNLDSRTSVDVMTLFQELNDAGITILIVTHEADIARYCKRIIRMRDGKVIADEPVRDRRIASEDLETLADLDEQDVVEVTL